MPPRPPSSTLFPYTTLFRSSLYPALQRLLMDDYLEAEWGVSENNRRARFYRITAAGRRKLAEEKKDRKSTRLNSSHITISYAVFCLKKKKKKSITSDRQKE